jgi:hypothetical protein
MLILVKDIGLLAFKAYTTVYYYIAIAIAREREKTRQLLCFFFSSEINIHLFSSHSIHIFDEVR